MPATPLTVVWDERARSYDFGPHHPFTEASRASAVRLLEAAGVVGGPDPPAARVDRVDPAPDELLRRFHGPEYLALVRKLDARGRREFLDRGDTPSFPGCFDAAARLVAATVAGARAVLDGRTVAAFHPGGGLHHAHPDRASGFCIFNDVALAVRTALDAGVGRVAYLDVDVHHGDGVMYGYYEDGRVLDIDFHQDGRTIFPGTGDPGEVGRGDGAGLKVNVPLPPRAGDEAFVPLFRRLVPPLVREHRPGLIVLQLGVDAHAGDGLGSLQYTHRSYDAAIATVLELAREVGGGRLLVTGGGGYAAGPVAVTLARAGARLAGHELRGALPESWRRAFEAEFDSTAPRSWFPEPARLPSVWNAELEGKLVGELEGSLGRKFPPADQSTAPTVGRSR